MEISMTVVMIEGIVKGFYRVDMLALTRYPGNE